MALMIIIAILLVLVAILTGGNSSSTSNTNYRSNTKYRLDMTDEEYINHIFEGNDKKIEKLMRKHRR